MACVRVANFPAINTTRTHIPTRSTLTVRRAKLVHSELTVGLAIAAIWAWGQAEFAFANSAPSRLSDRMLQI